MADLRTDANALVAAANGMMDVARQLVALEHCAAVDAFGSPSVDAAWQTSARARQTMTEALRDTTTALGTLAAETERALAEQDARLAAGASR